MRPIKFRAWDKSNKRFLYSGIHDRNWYATPKNDEGGAHCVRAKEPSDAHWLILMQFTGLHDKNAYEDDIVSWKFKSDLLGQVVWSQEKAAFGLDLTCFPNQIWKGEKFVIPDWDEWEVVGNILENPKLLDTNEN